MNHDSFSAAAPVAIGGLGTYQLICSPSWSKRGERSGSKMPLQQINLG
ncbi:MAG: hypothetical protein AAF063_28065 [Cyanobacteria bacterium J06643_5]